MIEVKDLEDLIMDLITEELEIIAKKGNKGQTINFELHKMRTLLYYTKWKRNLLDEADLEG